MNLVAWHTARKMSERAALPDLDMLNPEAVPRQNLEAHLKSTRCKRGCVTCYMCPAGAVMGQDEVFGRHN